MTTYDFLKFLFKWKWTLILGTVCVAGLVAYKVFQEPPRFSSASKILIERNRTPIQVGPEQQLPALGMIEVMNTEIEIVQSRTVLQAAVDALGYHDRAAMAQAAAEDDPTKDWRERLDDALVRWGLIQVVPPREQWVQELAARISVVPVPDSNVFTISMSGTNPERIARIVNTVTDMYLKHRLDVYKAQGRTEVYEAQMQGAWQELLRLRSELDAFERENNLSAIDEMRQSLAARSQELHDRLATQNQELVTLQARYFDQYPAVVATKERIADIERQLAAIAADRRRIEDRASTVRNLEVEIESQSNTYNLAKARFDEQLAKESASIAAANILVVEYADVPISHSTVRLHMIIFGAVAGLIMAIVVALLREYFDHHLDEPERAEQVLGVPVVGSVGRFRISPNGLRSDAG